MSSVLPSSHSSGGVTIVLPQSVHAFVQPSSGSVLPSSHSSPNPASTTPLPQGCGALEKKSQAYCSGLKPLGTLNEYGTWPLPAASTLQRTVLDSTVAARVELADAGATLVLDDVGGCTGAAVSQAPLLEAGSGAQKGIECGIPQ